MLRRDSRPGGNLRLLAVALVSGAVLAAPITASRATNWKEFGAGRTASADGLSFVLCLDTESVRSNGDIVTYRQRAHGRNATCDSGTAIKIVHVDCAHQGAARYLANSPELRSIFGPASALNDYVCAHRSASPATAQDDDCSRYIAALDRCVGLAPTDKIRQRFSALREAAVDLSQNGADLARLTCKADLPNIQNCLGFATSAPASEPAAKPRLAEPAPEHGDRLKRQAPLPEQRESPHSTSKSVKEQSGYGILTTRPHSGAGLSREQALSAAPRIVFESLAIRGSISLRGARFDDLTILKPERPLLNPRGTADAFYVEIGWLDSSGAPIITPDTMWQTEGSAPLSPVHPVTLTFANGKGLEIRRTISIDDKYMIMVQDQFRNYSAETVVLRAKGLIGRAGVPTQERDTDGFVADGPAQGVQSVLYRAAAGARSATFDGITSWIGLTTKKHYLVVQLWPDASVHAHTSFKTIDGESSFQAEYLLDPITIGPGEMKDVVQRIYVGPEEAALAYHKALGQ